MHTHFQVDPPRPARGGSPGPLHRLRVAAGRWPGWLLALLLLLGDGPGLAASPSLSKSGEGHAWGTVRAVVDAGNIAVSTPKLGRLELRLAGIELPERSRPARGGSPEVPGQPFGEEAAALVRELLFDKQVRVDTYGRDGSGRLLAVVWLGEISVNLTLVKEGLAWVDPSFPVSKVRLGLEVAERQAQVGRYGLWALPNPEPPWEYRKRLGLGEAGR